MRHRFRTTQWLPYPVELVFAFFANPANLPKTPPDWQQARIDEIELTPCFLEWQIAVRATDCGRPRYADHAELPANPFVAGSAIRGSRLSKTFTGTSGSVTASLRGPSVIGGSAIGCRSGSQRGPVSTARCSSTPSNTSSRSARSAILRIASLYAGCLTSLFPAPPSPR